MMSLDVAVDNLVKAIEDVNLRVQILLLEQRITELELIQSGTEIIKDILGE